MDSLELPSIRLRVRGRPGEEIDPKRVNGEYDQWQSDRLYTLAEKVEIPTTPPYETVALYRRVRE